MKNITVRQLMEKLEKVENKDIEVITSCDNCDCITHLQDTQVSSIPQHYYAHGEDEDCPNDVDGELGPATGCECMPKVIIL